MATIVIKGVPCTFAGLASPQPPKSDPVWEGHTDGAIYGCEVDRSSSLGAIYTASKQIFFWAADPPAPPPPDPAVLAQRAVESMNLRAITIGMVPDSTAINPDSVGLVGMPNWMWVQAPDAHSWGPITRTATAGGYSVTATASVASVTWDMGDGQVVTCGAGTPYEDSFGKKTSPDCGHTYTRQGRYTVRATSHWVVTWSGMGRSGTIPITLTQSAPVTIGEVQVLQQW